MSEKREKRETTISSLVDFISCDVANCKNEVLEGEPRFGWLTVRPCERANPIGEINKDAQHFCPVCAPRVLAKIDEAKR